MNLNIGLTDGDKGIYRRRRTEIPVIVCVHCGVLVTAHARCSTCSILIHKINYNCHCGAAHTLTEDDKDCTSCVKVRVHGRQEYDLDALSYLTSDLF